MLKGKGTTKGEGSVKREREGEEEEVKTDREEMGKEKDVLKGREEKESVRRQGKERKML